MLECVQDATEYFQGRSATKRFLLILTDDRSEDKEVLEAIAKWKEGEKWKKSGIRLLAYVCPFVRVSRTNDMGKQQQNCHRPLLSPISESLLELEPNSLFLGPLNRTEGFELDKLIRTIHEAQLTPPAQ